MSIQFAYPYPLRAGRILPPLYLLIPCPALLALCQNRVFFRGALPPELLTLEYSICLPIPPELLTLEYSLFRTFAGAKR